MLILMIILPYATGKGISMSQKKPPKILYHCTLHQNLKEILKKGLIPKIPEKFGTQPKGVYFSISPFEWMHYATLGDLARGAMITVNVKGLELFEDNGEVISRSGMQPSRGFYVKETIPPRRFVEVVIEDLRTHAFVPMKKGFKL